MMTKSLVIEFLEIAEANLLNSLLKLRPEDVYKQAHPEFNSIAWIFGHLDVWILFPTPSSPSRTFEG